MAVSKLEGKKCFITGAASGIGLATAQAVAAKGAAVFLTDIDEEKLDSAAARIRGAGGDVALHAALDVSDHDAVRALGARIHEAHGAMDVVMNIAGVSVWGAVEELEHRQWKRTIDVNLMGPVHVIETFVPEMIRAGKGGHLVNVSSAAGLLGLPWHVAYSASKFGLRGISEVLRFDLERHGIGVSLVCPGAVDTGLVNTLEVAGIDTSHPHVQRMRAEFREHAISPERAAQAIVRGVEQNRYLVFTSFDIRAAFWLQRFLPAGYAFIMRRLNDKLHRVGVKAKVERKSPGSVLGAGSAMLMLLVALFVGACGGSEDGAEGAGATGGAAAGGSAGSGAGGSGATGGSGASGNGGTGGGGAPFDLSVFACPGGSIAEGMNDVEVGGQTRSFHAQFPADTSQPLGVIFSWHGYNDPGSDGDAAGWRNAHELDADADPAFPVIVVTPIDADVDIPTGLDWQLDEGSAADNVDLAFFEAMLGCLNTQYDIDATRVHSYGFSAGSVMTSLIHSAYPGLVSAVACVSGMWFNDPAQVDMINLVPVNPSWPPLDPADGGTILLTHGGPSDVTVLNVANLEDMAQAAFPFLKAAHRIVVDCAHADGHTLHPELTTAHVMKFFADHRGGQPSPYEAGELTGYPSSCTLRLP